jgi:small subunit ribosomal protein S6
MAANVYECMFLLDTNKVAGDVHNAEQQLLSLVQKHNAEPLAYRPWDERRLAYPIAKHKKGLYYLMYFRSEGKNLATIEHEIGMNEMIVRSLIIKIDPKLVETMLTLVKGEHAPALHALQDDSGEGETTPRVSDAEGGDRPGRRPRRSEGEVKE